MKPINKLILDDIAAAKDAYKIWSLYEGKINDRVNYIVRKLAKIFGGKIKWWDWGAMKIKSCFSNTISLGRF